MAHESKKKKTLFLFPRIDFDKLTPLFSFANNWFRNQRLQLTGRQRVQKTIIKGSYIGPNLAQSY